MDTRSNGGLKCGTCVCALFKPMNICLHMNGRADKYIDKDTDCYCDGYIENKPSELKRKMQISAAKNALGRKGEDDAS